MHLVFIIQAVLALPLQDEPRWPYVVPPEGDPHRAPAPSALWLSPTVPEGLEVQVEAKGPELRFAQIRYGDAGSTRIAVAIDRPAGGEPILYVDAGRDRILGEEDRVAGGGPAWEISLATLTREEEMESLVPRRVFLRLTGLENLVAYGTLGWLEGRVEIAGKSCNARRMDADGNGFFTDPDDRLWLDMDGDGTWAPFDERFAYAPILTLSGARYALRSDRLGRDLSVEKIEGLGRIRLRLPARADGQPRKDVIALQALLVGKDGSAVGVQGYDVAVEVPVGEYRIGMLTLALGDARKREPWSFVFSEPGGRSELRWYAVARDAEVVIDPVGALRFEVGTGDKKAFSRGDSIVARPALYTGDGLLINTCYRGGAAGGRGGSGPAARVRLSAPGGELLDEHASGFA